MNTIESQPTDAEPTARTGVRGTYLAFMVAGLALLAISAGLVVWQLASGTDDSSTAAVATDYATLGDAIVSADGNTITYVIPHGTRARIAAGEEVAVIPAKITVKVGQTVVLRNEDTDAHIAGPFFVGPGQESTYSFSEPKTIEGDCTIHPSGSFEIDVVAA